MTFTWVYHTDPGRLQEPLNHCEMCHLRGQVQGATGAPVHGIQLCPALPYVKIMGKTWEYHGNIMETPILKDLYTCSTFLSRCGEILLLMYKSY